MSSAHATRSDERAADRREAFWQRPAIGVLAAVIWLIGALPPRLSYLIADVLAVPWYLFWRLTDRRGRRRRGYWFNTAIAFRPGAPLGPARPPYHLWRWSRHMARLVPDFCLMRRMNAANVDRYVDLTEYERLVEAFAADGGVICATGHVGPWDVAGVSASLRGLPLVSVFRPGPIPALDRLIARLRTRSGQQVVARKRVMWTLKKVLADGGAIGVLCDGGGKHSSVVAPFLGTPARTVATPAVLHLTTGAPIAVVTMHRIGCMRYRMRVHDIIRHTPTDDRDRDLREITARVNRGLSAGIAESPAQWFWQSRRFRHRPADETPDADGLPPLWSAPTSQQAATGDILPRP